MDDHDDEKSLSPSQAATVLGVAAETLRYWERAGLLAPVGRDSGHRRRYREADMGYLDVIRCLRLTGMPVAGVRAFADLARTGPDTTEARMDLLRDHRAVVIAAIAEQTRAVDVIDAKITAYERTTP